MGDGYSFLGYGVVKTTFLLGDTEYINGNSLVQVDEPLQYTPKPR